MSLVDPEDLIEIIADYQREITAAIERFGGQVSRFEGDGAFAFFGYPTGLEDCAAMAVRAALKLVSVVTEIGARHAAAGGLTGPDVKLEVRVGVETGIVTISGGPTASGRIGDTFFAGAAPNMVARLQTVAPVGGVAVGPVTRRLVSEAFEWAPLGTHPLKGFAEPIEVHQVVAERVGTSRLERRLMRTRTPMINRVHELRVLGDAWRDALEGQIRCV